MVDPESSDVIVFATDAERQRSRRFYILLLKLTLIPVLMIMGFLSGALLEGSGLPQGVRVVISLILGPLLPWLALRALNRRLRFWFALRPDGLECGPGKFRWMAPYDDVALIRASHRSEPGEPYLEVKTGKKSGWVLMSPDELSACVQELLERCPCAVWIDSEAEAYPPAALREDASSEIGQRAVQNMELVGQMYGQAGRRVAVISLLFLAGAIAVALSYLGLIPIEPKARVPLTVVSLGLFAAGAFDWFMVRRKAQKWDEIRGRFTASFAPVSSSARP